MHALLLRRGIVPGVFWLVVLFISGCGSSKDLASLNAEARFRLAMSEFEKEKYLDAIESFRFVTLQFPGSAVADSAQFYLAESYFRRHEYLLAAAEYETLIRTMSTSPFVPTSRYQIGLCYYELSPKSELDQKYTYQALDALQTFIEYHPTNPLVPEAEAKIRELNTKLAKKEYDSGVIYMRMEKYTAAARQFDFVLEKYHDTDYAPQALIGKIQALMARRRCSEAKIEVDKFFDRYPENPQIEQARSLKKDVEDCLQATPKPKAEGKSPSLHPTSKSETKD